ncbi:MAG: hypothetical protein WCV85_01100 [Patescibacteria group bacterium]
MQKQPLFCLVSNGTGSIIAITRAYSEKQALYALKRRGVHVDELSMDIFPANKVSAEKLFAFRRKQHRQIVREHTKPPTATKKKMLGRQLSLLEN